MKSKKSFIWQIVYIVVTMAALYFLALNNEGFKSIGQNLKEFNLYWLSACAGCMLMFWLLQTLVLRAFEALLKVRIRFRQSLKITVIGQYYCAITPSATGGQPMQMMYYKRYGVNFAKSSAIMLLRLIVFNLALVVIFIAMLFIAPQPLYAVNAVYRVLAYLGLLINGGSMLFMALLFINDALVRCIGFFVINLITLPRRLRKRREHLCEKYVSGMVDFMAACSNIQENKGLAFMAFFWCLVSLIFRFSVSFCIYKTLGLSGYGYWYLFSLEQFLYMSVAFVPTPGAIGASEPGFGLYFAGVIPGSLMCLALLLWRGFTYFFTLILGALMIITEEAVSLIKKRKAGPRNQASPTET